MRLREIAHARSGDKGDTSQISVIPYDPDSFGLIRARVTVAAVEAHFRAVLRGPVERHELPQLGILNFVLNHALSSGVTRSLALDAHGKCLSSLMLDLPIAPLESGCDARGSPADRRSRALPVEINKNSSNSSV